MNRFFFILFSFLFALNFKAFSQDLPLLDFENLNFPKSIVISAEGKTEAELKSKVETWINSSFTEANLLEHTFENDQFSVTAFENRIIKVKNLTCDIKFDLKISIRNNRYRFEVSSLSYKYYTEYRPIANIDLIKDSKIRDDLIANRSIIGSFFNSLSASLYSKILDQSDDW